MMDISLTNVAETLLIPLWARAYETIKSGEHLVEDPKAVALVHCLHYDFDKFAAAKKSQVGVAIRSAILDREVKAFVKEHANAVCINLACGLDTRFYRIDTGFLDWYNLDLPEVMELRQQLLPDDSSRLHSIGKSLLDPSWPDDVITEGRPVLILMEGASMYFSEEEMKGFFALLANRFTGAHMFLEVMTKTLIRLQHRHDSVDTKKTPFRWGINGIDELETLNGAICVERRWTLYEGYRDRWGWMGIFSCIPWWNHHMNDQIIHLRLREER